MSTDAIGAPNVQGKAVIIPSNPNKVTKAVLAIRANLVRISSPTLALDMPRNRHLRLSMCSYSPLLNQPLSKVIAVNRKRAPVEVLAPLAWPVSFVVVAPKVGDILIAAALPTDHHLHSTLRYLLLNEVRAYACI